MGQDSLLVNHASTHSKQKECWQKISVAGLWIKSRQMGHETPAHESSAAEFSEPAEKEEAGRTATTGDVGGRGGGGGGGGRDVVQLLLG